MERTKVISVVNNTAKAPKNQGFLEKCFQNGHSFSSQPRYGHFGTSPKFLTFALYHTVPNLQALTANLFRDRL